MSGPASSFLLYTLAQLRAAILPEPRPIVEGILNEGETILLVGRPKVGKSRLIQQLTLELSRAQPFLGRYAITKPCRVLVIDLENRPAVAKVRFTLMATPEESDSEIFVYAPETLAEGLVDTSLLGLTRLNDLITRADPEVLIIDTWRLFVDGNENDASVVVTALKSLSDVRRFRPQMAIILVHHLRKEQRDTAVRLREDPSAWVENVSGHHALVGHVDACYGLEREINAAGEELIVFGGVSRNSACSALLLDEDDMTLRFSVRSGDDAARAAMTPRELDIWAHAKRLGKFTFTALFTAAGTTNKKAVSSMLRKAESHGVLRKDGKSEYVVVP